MFLQGFHEPHDLAVTRDGNTVYVGELDDNSVWKFDKPEEEMWTAELVY